MSGFMCPNCKCETQLFAATSGGAEKMCLDFDCINNKFYYRFIIE